ncbi:MAG: TVP38/TMEM64 family protein [Clostridia bacterium]|nr:TVP38/TMEM64 family protein [Clostridia bacterium]
MSQQAKTILYLLLSLLLAIAGSVGSCWLFFRQTFPLHELCGILIAVLFGAAWVLLCISARKGWEKTMKFTLTGMVFAAILVVGVVSLELAGAWELLFDREALQAWIAGTGVWAPAVYILLQFAQTVILPIPTVIAIAVGVYIFGAPLCALYSYIGCVTGSLVAFWIGRKLGYKVVSWLIGKETLDLWLKKIKGKDAFILTAMFLLPFFPDDVLCFVAGLSSMSGRFFLCMILISRAIAISTTAFPLDLIPFTTWWGILIWVLIFAVVIVAMYFIYRHQEKILSYLQKFKKKKKK